MNATLEKLIDASTVFNEYNNVTYFDRQKFMELVICECISIVEREASQYSAPTWSVEIINDICDTFGVEP